MSKPMTPGKFNSPAPLSDAAKALAASAAATLETAANAERKRGIEDLGKRGQNVFRVNPYLIEVATDFNKRDFSSPDNVEHVDNLARSIAQHGVQMPLTVSFRDGVLYLVDGECRLHGTKRAIETYGATEIRDVPVRMEARNSSEIDRLIAQATLNTGKPFTPIESAALFFQLGKFGLSDADIAAKVGMTPQRVAQISKLNSLAPEAKRMVARGEVSASTAAQVLNANGGDAKAALAALVDAKAAATAAGKAKVTPKIVAATARRPAQASPKGADLSPLAKLVKTMAFTVTDAVVNAEMDQETYAALLKLAGLPVAGASASKAPVQDDPL